MGGGPSIPQRNLTDELGQTFGAFKSQELPIFNNQWFNGQPLLKKSKDLASGALTGLSPYLLDIIGRHGALSPEQLQEVGKDTFGDFATRGNAVGNQAFAANLLNRDQFQRQRLNEALGQEAGVINPALQTEQTAVGTFASLINPLLSYASNLNEGNQNAAGAQSIAGSNKTSGAVGGGLSAIASIAPLLALSDKRAKADIKDTGLTTEKGVPLQTWRYKGGFRRFLGPLAQEVEKILPDAVFTDRRTGLKRVNLPAAGMPHGLVEVPA